MQEEAFDSRAKPYFSGLSRSFGNGKLTRYKYNKLSSKISDRIGARQESAYFVCTTGRVRTARTARYPAAIDTDQNLRREIRVLRSPRLPFPDAGARVCCGFRTPPPLAGCFGDEVIVGDETRAPLKISMTKSNRSDESVARSKVVSRHQEHASANVIGGRGPSAALCVRSSERTGSMAKRSSRQVVQHRSTEKCSRPA